MRLLYALCIFLSLPLAAQLSPQTQLQINRQLTEGFTRTISVPSSPSSTQNNYMPVWEKTRQMQALSPEAFMAAQPPQQLLNADTLIVGLVANDTLVITGNWTHTGPIWVFNDGVLIFNNATVSDTGDIYVWGQGKLFAQNSSLSFPQAFFYERGMYAFQQGEIHLQNCSLNYSGMSHYLGLAGNVVLEWNNVHNADWTTASVLGQTTVNINGSNLTGEYILQDSTNVQFTHADSVILWHHFPPGALINYAFPPGDTLYNYIFNNTQPGVTGINYNAAADSCTNVLWALMPVNGSDVTINNSDLRLIGCWFQYGDTALVYGIFNNSNYTSYTTPLSERNLQLNNTSVETWSMYVFDSSAVLIDSCVLGEVGAQQHASIQAGNTVVDGSGGYFWSTDSTTVFGIGTLCYTTCRSEKQSTFVLGYSWLPFMPPTAVQQSTLIAVQNNLAFDPLPYNGGVVWMAALEQPDTAAVNMQLPVNGSAWIDQGPDGNPTAFGSYSLAYQFPAQSPQWNAITTNAATEVRHAPLAVWNTTGLQPGTYVLKLTLYTATGDSVEAFNPIVLMSNPLGLPATQANTFSVWPNPAGNVVYVDAPAAALVRVYDMQGREVLVQQVGAARPFAVQLGELEAGVYLLRVGDGVVRVVKE